MLDTIRTKNNTEKKIGTVVGKVDNIGMLSVLLRSGDILKHFEKCLENDLIGGGFECKESYMLSVFDDAIRKNTFSVEKRATLVETIIGKTSKNNRWLCVTLMGMCSIHLIKEEYYDLSDILRRVAFHLAEENSERTRVKLEGILKKFMPIVKKEDPYGFDEVMDILSEIYPIEEQGII